MKPSNPMQQLQQWKANNGKSNKLKMSSLEVPTSPILDWLKIRKET